MEILKSCILGIIVIIVGIVLRVSTPTINNTSGYKTPFSMKNKDTWDEANRFCGVLLIFIGIIFIVVSIMFYYMNISKNLSFLFLFILFLTSIVFTEIHLRNVFDKNGIKKKLIEKNEEQK